MSSTRNHTPIGDFTRDLIDALPNPDRRGKEYFGAAVVTRRNLHLRMDVLVRFLPASVRVALRVAEQVLLAVLAGFVLTQSYFYARQMWRIGRTSDMAGIPMWIPHATVALGFGLILVVALCGLVRMMRRMPEREAEP